MDAINKPAHYNQGSIECIEAMKIVLTPEEYRGYLKGNVFKYLWREKDKNGNEDIRKGKSYYDRLIELIDESEAEQLATGEAAGEGTWEVKPPDGWRPNDTVSLAMQMAANSFGRKDGVFNGANFSNAMRQLAGVTCNLDGYVVATILDGRSDVEVLKGGSHYRYLFYESINSSQERVEPPKQQTPTEPPEGWRWLEVGEVFRKGDTTNTIEPIPKHWVGTQCVVKHVALRRNKFEVGEKVVHVDDRHATPYEIDEYIHSKDAYVVKYKNGHYMYHWSKLVPYIEEAT